jgi:hypothetical protein
MRVNLILSQHCNMSLDTLNTLIPWERTTYFSMYLEDLKKQEESMKQNG